jgi:hypothetical protein
MSSHDGQDSAKVARSFQGVPREFSVAVARGVSCHEVELSPNFPPSGHWSAEGPLQQAALHRHNGGVRAIVHAQFVHGGRHVRLPCAFSDAERRSDLFVQQPSATRRRTMPTHRSGDSDDVRDAPLVLPRA